MEEKQISQADMIILNSYIDIYQNFPYGNRAPELTRKDEIILEIIYNKWRGGQEVILDCDECVEEAFDRLCKQMLIQQGMRKEFGITEVDKLRAELRARVGNKLRNNN